MHSCNVPAGGETETSTLDSDKGDSRQRLQPTVTADLTPPLLVRSKYLIRI
jgi:hypothetical protein